MSIITSNSPDSGITFFLPKKEIVFPSSIIHYLQQTEVFSPQSLRHFEDDLTENMSSIPTNQSNLEIMQISNESDSSTSESKDKKSRKNSRATNNKISSKSNKIYKCFSIEMKAKIIEAVIYFDKINFFHFYRLKPSLTLKFRKISRYLLKHYNDGLFME